MKLIDYIKGTRRGREANKIERQAMIDPFTSEAIEGYDAVYGNHSDELKAIEEQVAKRATKRRHKARGPMTPAPEVLAYKTYKPGDKVEVAPKVEETAQPEATVEETVPSVATQPVEQAPRQEIAPMTEYRENNVKPSGAKRALTVGIAAVITLIVAGSAWYFLIQPLDVDDMHEVADLVVYDTTEATLDPEVSVMDMDVAEDEKIDIPPAPRIVETAEQPIAKPVEKPVEKPVARAAEPKKEAEPIVKKAEEKPVSPATTQNATATRTADASTASQPEATPVVESIPAAKILPAQTAEPATTRTAEPTPTAQASVPAETPAAPAEAPEYITNDKFQLFFRRSSKLLGNEETPIVGKVVVEFRVNAKGVPSGIRVISSPDPAAGQEVVSLLVAGPAWEPTDGQRIRTTVEYK